MTLKAYGAHDLVDAIVDTHWRSVLPGERLLRGVDRWEAGDCHRERLRTLGLPQHTLHDSRHHWAVRIVRAGMPLELVARQLGHKDVLMVARVYGRFVPNSQERDRWESIAAALDDEKWVVPVHWTVQQMRKHLSWATLVPARTIAGVGLEPTTPAL